MSDDESEPPVTADRQDQILSSLRSVNREIGSLIDELCDAPLTADLYLEARARLGRLEAEFDELGNQLSRTLGLGSARSRILRYLIMHVGEIVTKEEISGVSGIFESPRRIRELRNDLGWQISSMETHSDLRPGEYILTSTERLRK